MRKLLLFVCLLMATPIFAVNVETQKSTIQTENSETQIVGKNLPQATTPTEKQLNWKERKALRIFNKKIQKAQKKNSGDIGGVFYTVGLIIVILGLIGLVLSLLGIGFLSIGLSGILLGLILMLIGKFIL